MAGYYDRSDWDYPEIADWRDEWSGEPAYGARCFPLPVLGGIGLGLGFGALACFPRNFGCRPRNFGCRPRFYGCRPVAFGCYPRMYGCYPV